MTRLQKKCFLASIGLHGLLLLILVASSAFRSKPPENDMLIMTLIPQNILDRAGAGGGSPSPAAAAPAPPQPAPAVVQPQPPAPPQHHETPVPPQPKPREIPRPREPDPEPQPEPSHAIATEPAPKPSRKTHEIHLSFDSVTPTSHKKTKVKPTETDPAEADAAAAASSASESRRLRQRIAQSLDALASGVKNSGAQGTVVDMPGQGGGEAFAGYETVIYNAYYHAWTAPDSVADKLASTDVKIVVSRDGTILSAEIVNKSGEPALDKSVERALRAVRSLPPFPAGARDEQRSFLIRFNLESKEGTG